jgi:AraC family transcriptional regulator
MTLKPARIVNSPALILAGRQGTFKIGPSPEIKDLWERFMTDFGRIEGQVGFKAYGVCYNFDGKGHMDYMAAVEVEDAGQVPGYLHTFMIPSRKVAVFEHVGGVETISETWSLIFSEGIPQSKLTLAVGAQFEAYPEDLGLEGATTPIEIHIPVT